MEFRTDYDNDGKFIKVEWPGVNYGEPARIESGTVDESVVTISVISPMRRVTDGKKRKATTAPMITVNISSPAELRALGNHLEILADTLDVVQGTFE